MQGFGELHAVQRLDLGSVARGVASLVGLQMADQHPLQAQAGQGRGFLADFLRLVLAVAGQPQRHGFADGVFAERLADGQQRHAVRAAPGALAGAGDALLDLGKAPGHGVYSGHSALG